MSWWVWSSQNTVNGYQCFCSMELSLTGTDDMQTQATIASNWFLVRCEPSDNVYTSCDPKRNTPTFWQVTLIIQWSVIIVTSHSSWLLWSPLASGQCIGECNVMSTAWDGLEVRKKREIVKHSISKCLYSYYFMSKDFLLATDPCPS